MPEHIVYICLQQRVEQGNSIEAVDRKKKYSKGR
jgi:hypothetical protein